MLCGLGLPVIVLQPFGEKLAGPRRAATCDRAGVQKQIDAVADRNIGIALGFVPGAARRLLVIEFDDEEALLGVELSEDALPETWCIRGPGDRLSYVYACPADYKPGEAAVRIAEGAVIRAEAETICAPPSRTPSGSVDWAPGAGPLEVDLAIAPSWVLARLALPADGHAGSEDDMSEAEWEEARQAASTELRRLAEQFDRELCALKDMCGRKWWDDPKYKELLHRFARAAAVFSRDYGTEFSTAVSVLLTADVYVTRDYAEEFLVSKAIETSNRIEAGELDYTGREKAK